MRKKASAWSEMGQYQREANYVDKIHAELADIKVATFDAIVKARTEYLKGSASSSFHCKQIVNEALARLSEVLTTAKIAEATSVQTILRLPAYHSADHITSRAQALALQTRTLIAYLDSLRSLLTRFRGDREEVGRALAALDVYT